MTEPPSEYTAFPALDYTDTTAPEHERRWRVHGDDKGGIIIEALADDGVVFDTIRLRRAGAWIELEIPPAPNVPNYMAFLRATIDAVHRLKLVGFQGELAPVLVHSEWIHRLFRDGHMPGMTQPPPAGRAEFFGVRVFWDERLDDHAGAL